MLKIVRWTAMGIGFLIVSIALASFALHLYGAFRLNQARSDFDTRWVRTEPAPPPTSLPDHANGARWLMAGGQAIICSTEDMTFLGAISGRSAREWTETEQSRAKWILHEQQNALAILLRSGSFDAFHLGTEGSRATYDEINVLDIVTGLRFLTVEARLAWIEGRTSDSLMALETVSRAADGLLRTPIVMASIVGSAANRWLASATADLVDDPCTSAETLSELRNLLPLEDPVHSSHITLVNSVAEIADEGLDYVEDFHDPSVSWSLPLWVSNRYLLEDLLVAGIVERWGRFLELGQRPAAGWTPDAVRTGSEEPSWLSWIALAGAYTPNLLRTVVGAQAASTEIQQLRAALDLRLASPDGLNEASCSLVDDPRPTALTGEPIGCRVDEQRGLIVIEVPGAAQALIAFYLDHNHNGAQLPPIELRMDVTDVGCEAYVTGPTPGTTRANR